MKNMKLTDAGAHTNEGSQGKDASHDDVGHLRSVAEEVNKKFDTEQRRVNAVSVLQDRKKEELLPAQ